MHIYSITPYHRCIPMNLSFQSVFVPHWRHNGKYFLILLYEIYWFNRKIVMKYSLVNTFPRKANSKFYCQPIICQTSNKHWKFTYFRIYFEQVSSRNSLFFKLFQGYGTLVHCKYPSGCQNSLSEIWNARMAIFWQKVALAQQKQKRRFSQKPELDSFRYYRTNT